MPPSPPDEERDHVDALLAQWEDQRPELDRATLGLAARVLRLHRVLERHVAEQLRPLGLHEGEVNVLAALRRAPPPHELTPTALYRSLLRSSGAMTHRLDRLERAGLVTRRPDPDDGRRVRVRLTATGLRVVDEALDAHTAAMAEVFGALEEAERHALNEHLKRLLARLERDGAGE